MQPLASQNAPSPMLVVSHFMAGAAFLLLVTVLILFFPSGLSQHFFNPGLLALTHLLVLGFITTIIFGALYQLIPVIMEVKLYSERLSVATLALLLSGTVLLAWTFWNMHSGMILFLSAILLVTAIILFAINVFVTALRSEKKIIEKNFIVTSVVWLAFTVIAGALLAINLHYPFLNTPNLELLKLHAHAGIAGWFIQLVIGVSSRLLPMFMVSHNLNAKKLKIAYYLINSGLPLGIVSLYFVWNPGVIIALLMVVAGILFFLSFLFEAYSKRVRKQLDTGMKQTAVAFLVFSIALLLVLFLMLGVNGIQDIFPRLSLIYGASLLLGFLTSLIMGQTFKTLPFIVWLKVYRSKVGKVKMPLPKDLYSDNIVKLQLWLFLCGFFFLMMGILLGGNESIRAGGLLLFFSAVSYNYNLYKIVLHK